MVSFCLASPSQLTRGLQARHFGVLWASVASVVASQSRSGESLKIASARRRLFRSLELHAPLGHVAPRCCMQAARHAIAAAAALPPL